MSLVPQPIQTQNNSMYKVEAILDKRIEPKTKQQQYFIKWDGYGIQVSTWEPIEHLEYCLDLVEEYEKKNIRSPRNPPKIDYSLRERSRSKRSLQERQDIISKWQNRLRVKQEICYNSQDPHKKQNDEEYHVDKIIQKVMKRRPLELLLRNRKKEQNNESKAHSSLQRIQKTQNPGKKREIKGDPQEVINKDIKPQVQKPKISALKRKDKVLTLKTKKIIKPISKKILSPMDDGRKKRKRNQGIQRVKRKNIIKKESQIEKQQIEEKKQIKEEKNKEEVQDVLEIDQGEKNPKQDIQLMEQEAVVKSRQGEEREIGKVEILGMRRMDGSYEFFLQKGSIQGWSTHKYVIQNYPRELCAFYEKNIEFD